MASKVLMPAPRKTPDEWEQQFNNQGAQLPARLSDLLNNFR